MPTWHVHHPAVAALQHGLLLTAQPAGRHAVSRVAQKLRLPLPALCPAVAPGLGQVGELERGRGDGVMPRSPSSPPVPAAASRSEGELERAGEPDRGQFPRDPSPAPSPGGTDPLLLAGHEGLEAWGHAEAQLVDVGGLLLAVDLHPDAGLKGRLVCRVEMPLVDTHSPSGPTGHCPPPTGVLVSLQMGRYSSCWMSSMISRPLPMPPARLGSELCGSALKV